MSGCRDLFDHDTFFAGYVSISKQQKRHVFLMIRSGILSFCAALLWLTSVESVDAQSVEQQDIRIITPDIRPMVDFESYTPSPFLIYGLNLDDPELILGENTKRLLAQGLEKYPDIRSCIQESGFTGGGVDLNAFVWRDFVSNQDIDVCLFWIANFLQSPQEMAEWLDDQGFHVVAVHETSYQQIRHFGGRGDGMSVTASWVRDRTEFPFDPNRKRTAPSFMRYFVGETYSFSVQIQFSEIDRPRSVQVAFKTK